ncbi:nuclear transport factor 2 family protein [Aurantiacibacter poecillastricola]|uniref:nuclear transport factor 2 family protein n=1 Tax=Aurantiacibacter poecillastricola TaxID=3064385 RepID=UPI00273E6F40|nr:nuclear transport factor 2 family protein [Aurantiacibacter sp. 219JJ12-13]MDP5260867.1 nuclear transport factor 2 family protein [Aurantiacibacter sp. 219JJ12-13]
MSLRLATVLAAGLALAACDNAGTGPPEMDTSENAAALGDPMDTSDRESLTDRQVSERFIEVFYNQNRLTDGFEAWVHPDYIQHDPNSPTGRDPTIAVLADHMQANPEMTHDVKRVIYGDEGPDGTLVAVHYHFKRAPDDRGSAVVDIYRVQDGYLVEHWDVIQPVPEEALNDNTMF